MIHMTVEDARALLRAARDRLDAARAHLANTPSGAIRASDPPTEAWTAAVRLESDAEANVRLWEERLDALESQSRSFDAEAFAYDHGFDAGYRAGYKDGRGSL